MSADNWTICPACKKRVDALNEARINAPALAYGKVSAEEYGRLIEAAKNLLPHEDTLREDYFVGINDGKFSVSYAGRCSACTFVHRFKHEEQLK